MSFLISEIPKSYQQSMIQKNIWTTQCPFNFDRLRLLNISHYDFNNEPITGEIIVFDAVATMVINIFQKLFDKKFPIFSMHLIDKFDGNDELSMASNNSSCFNYRSISGTNNLSLHALAMAIDINPVQNPYLAIDHQASVVTVHPSAGTNYINRSKDYTGKVEPIIEIFHQYGFKIWGGNWSEPIDYHHFQVERHIAEQLIKLDYKTGFDLFTNYIKTI